MEFTVQNLEYAVSVFYNSEQNERAQAHQWLTVAQRCPEAWSFVWELLQSTKGTEVQFFAATTLHTKLLRCWHELPPESYEELKNKIIQTILAYANGPKIILNRLCIGLAAFILQQGSADLVTILTPFSTAPNMALLLEILTVIPEEFNSMTMGTTLRIKNRTALQQACPAVLDDMLRYLQSVYNEGQPTEETMLTWCAAALCSSSWMSLNADENYVRDEGTSSSLTDRLPICHALLKVVEVIYSHYEVISDTALEACETSLNAIRVCNAGPDAARYPNAALQIITALAQLARTVLERDNVPNSYNEELLSAIATCAVSLADNHSRAIVTSVQQNHEGAKLFLEVLLMCQAAPGHYPLHETRSQLVFPWWYTLQDEILYLKDNTGDVDQLWPAFFSRLFNILIAKCEAPNEDALSRDDAELLRCYRQDVSDTVMYCYNILSRWSWSLVETSWREATTEARREASLHVFLTLADAAPHQDTPPELITMLQHAVDAANTTNDSRQLNTALECLGAYASWLSGMEATGRRLAAGALAAAGGALGRAPHAAAAAALALKKLCTECAALAAPLAHDIVMAVKRPEVTSDAWVKRQLVGAAGAALAAADGDVTDLLNKLAHITKVDLEQQVKNPAKGNGSAEAASALLTSLVAKPPLAAQYFVTILPALVPYADIPALVPPLFLVLKQAVCVLLDHCSPSLQQMCELTVKAINTAPCPSGLDLTALIVQMFGNDWPHCQSLLRHSVSTAAGACASDPSSRSDLTEALFVTLHKITKRKTQFLTALDDMMPQLVDLCCECIRMWESGAARAACRWAAALCAERPQALEHKAPGLLVDIVRCIGGATPRNQMEPLSELLLAMNRASWSSAATEAGPGAGPGPGAGAGAGGTAVWLRAALEPPGFPTAHAHDAAKHKFLAAVVKERTSKFRLIDVVQEFSFVCRGLIDTEYARQALSGKQYV